MPNSPEYLAWRDMIRRCHDRADKDYPHYGGRGLFVCDRWRSSYDLFVADVGLKPKGKCKYVLARRDVNGSYEPGNVEWRLRERQANNKRVSRTLEVNGRVMTLSEAANMYGLTKHTLRKRLDEKGMGVAQALILPVRPSCGNGGGVINGATLTCADAARIKRLWSAGGWTKKDLAVREGVSATTIRRIVNGQAWKKVTRYA